MPCIRIWGRAYISRFGVGLLSEPVQVASTWLHGDSPSYATVRLLGEAELICLSMQVGLGGYMWFGSKVRVNKARRRKLVLTRARGLVWRVAVAGGGVLL